MNNNINRLVKRVALHRFHRANNFIAEEILKDLESVNGKTDQRLIKLSDDYARDVLGWKGYAPWLYVYSSFNNEFKEGWIPDNYFAKVVLPVISGDYGKLSDHKPLSGRLFQSDVFPDIGCYVNGLYFDNTYQLIPENHLIKSFFGNSDTIVFKIDNSMQGKGVYLFDRSSFDTQKIKRLGNGVFQDFIEQHPFFSQLMPSSVATIRLTTYYQNNGDISIRAGFLRLGRMAEQSIKWSSNIIIPIDLKTGQLSDHGYYPNLISITEHPDTQIAFSGLRVPFIDKCCTTAIELHRKVPFDRCIGWDMVTDKYNNVKVMEWNGDHTDIKIHEATQGPCFSDLGWENLWRQPAHLP